MYVCVCIHTYISSNKDTLKNFNRMRLNFSRSITNLKISEHKLMKTSIIKSTMQSQIVFFKEN